MPSFCIYYYYFLEMFNNKGEKVYLKYKTSKILTFNNKSKF